MRFSRPLALLALALAASACQSKSNSNDAAKAAPLASVSATTEQRAAPAKTAEAPAAPEEPKGLPAPADVAAPPATAKKTASGLAYTVLTKGTGKDHPTESDRVRVHYTGWTKDGKMFDSSVLRGEPAAFGVSGVIPGWTEALKLMVQGEKIRAWIPGALAYGDNAMGGAPAGQLTFDIELIEIVAAPKPPKDVAAPPPTAKKTASGLAYRVISKGKGKTHPTATSQVTVHYTGWTKDGKMFDSSVVRGAPTTFGLDQVIPGWTEGVQLMVEGEKALFWIPGKLAYGETPARPGAPGGQLTFEIELLQIR
jgi:peptidylprolyl isomerase